jgi:hypothetical protein
MKPMRFHYSCCRRTWFGGVLLPVIAAFVVSGCSGPKGPTLNPVAGTVTLDGQPLAQGSIVFDPADGKGIATAGAIKDGAFKADCPAGIKVVRISASKETGEKDEYGSIVSISLIPDDYNSKSSLNANIAAGNNSGLKFELVSKPTP